MTRRADDSRALRLLSSFPTPRSTTNPYIVQLHRELGRRTDVRAATFTWRRALFSRYDVFHAHWPEILVNGASFLKKTVRQILFAILLVRLWVLRVAVVRTVHNLELPNDISRREQLLLRTADRMVALRIVLSEHTPLPAGQAFAVIPHGHYRDWFAEHHKPESEPGRVVFFGLVRRYKSIDDLIRAFRAVDREGAARALRIAGLPTSARLRDELVALSGNDPRVSMRFEFLDDASLVDEAARAELVALPYREMHNSGAALTALSLGRPVLVPDNAVNRALRAEVGEHWVQLFDDALSAAAIETALARLHATPSPVAPDLSRRDWSRAGADHVAAYRRAIELARAHRRAPRRR